MPFLLPTWWNWKTTYAFIFLLLLILLLSVFYSMGPYSTDSISASVVWGGVTLMLSLIFMLGAAQTPMQFLIFFGTGAFGAGAGYLVGAWLTPSGDSNPLDEVRNIVAGVLTGVVGTKLLTLWDNLVNAPPGGGRPPIMTAVYYVPVAMWLVGFTVSLSAFYTVRTGQSGDVRVTYAPRESVRLLGAKHVGVLPETVVSFAAAANSPVDVTAKWDFQMEESCGAQKEMGTAFDTATGRLTAPSQTVLQKWIDSCPGSQNWVLTATSNQDHSKLSRYSLKFCKTKEDCPIPGATAKPAPTAKSPEKTGTR